MNTKRKIITGAIVAASLALIAGGVLLVRTVIELPDNAYAMWGAGDLVVEHLKRTTNAWPKSWTDLEHTYRLLEREHAHSVHSTLEEMRSRIQIDWTADVSDLVRTPFTNSVRPFAVIRLLNGKRTHYRGTEPNAAVWEYLQTVSNSVPVMRPAISR